MEMKNLCRILVLALALLTITTASWGDDVPNNPTYAQAIHFTKLNQWDKAKEAFQRIIDDNPSDAFGHYSLGCVFLHNRQWEAALEELKTSENLNPNSAKTHSALGEVLIHKKKYSQAISEIKDSINLNPNDTWPHELLANLYLKTNQINQLEKEYNTLVALGDPQTAKYKEKLDKAKPQVQAKTTGPQQESQQNNQEQSPEETSYSNTVEPTAEDTQTVQVFSPTEDSISGLLPAPAAKYENDMPSSHSNDNNDANGIIFLIGSIVGIVIIFFGPPMAMNAFIPNKGLERLKRFKMKDSDSIKFEIIELIREIQTGFRRGEYSELLSNDSVREIYYKYEDLDIDSIEEALETTKTGQLMKFTEEVGSIYSGLQNLKRQTLFGKLAKYCFRFIFFAFGIGGTLLLFIKSMGAFSIIGSMALFVLSIILLCWGIAFTFLAGKRKQGLMIIGGLVGGALLAHAAFKKNRE